MGQQQRNDDPGERAPQGLRERLARWWDKLRGKVVMDAPPDWDVHPDVARKIRERDEA